MDIQQEQDGFHPPSPITVTDDVIAYMNKRGGDFRISTSCSGPVLMPAKARPAKQSDIPIKAGSHVIYVSQYQLPWITEINMQLVPRILYTENDDL
ncbi:MAG TPA: hypothetical protein O0X23_03350 [Methanocorpusculum sp.]|nr:hypothetical protein [Methanocorpusculum sp.]